MGQTVVFIADCRNPSIQQCVGRVSAGVGGVDTGQRTLAHNAVSCALSDRGDRLTLYWAT